MPQRAAACLVVSSRADAEKFVRAGWSPSGITVDGEWADGAAYVIAHEKEPTDGS